ncbi:hypothetical protein CLU80_4477 [Pseudomonas sp. 29]|jgi:hypothetical protein|nr:hypothetical protein CLU80_4477 [Pseudomonas sp. 29]SEP20298.1 hypothetical protein SAMN04487856_115190 [Pseudomonas sp. ok266]
MSMVSSNSLNKDQKIAASGSSHRMYAIPMQEPEAAIFCFYSGKYRLNNARNAAGFTGLAR